MCNYYETIIRLSVEAFCRSSPSRISAGDFLSNKTDHRLGEVGNVQLHDTSDGLRLQYVQPVELPRYCKKMTTEFTTLCYRRAKMALSIKCKMSTSFTVLLHNTMSCAESITAVNHNRNTRWNLRNHATGTWGICKRRCAWWSEVRHADNPMATQADNWPNGLSD